MTKLKCAHIYESQTANNSGSYNGTATGLGLTSNGLGIGMGEVSGSINSTTQTNLAKMFKPIQTKANKENFMLSFFGILLGAMGSLKSKNITDFFLNEYNLSETNMNNISWFFTITMVIMIFACLQDIIKRSKVSSNIYSDDELLKINTNYQNIWYDSLDHTIFLNEKNKLPANRENFEEMVIKG